MAKPRTNKWRDLKSRMSPEAQARVDARVSETLASMPLAEIRKAIGMTQTELAGSLEIAQGSVSKMENQADMYLSTLRKYVHALGGELHLTAEFPDGRKIEIAQLSDLAAS
jgi:DNA-binding XRE family transcriptional regulator